MFYSHDILRRRGGKFGIIWLAAFREKTLTRRDVFSVDVEQSCNDVIEYIVRNHRRERPRFSLYLSSQLLYGSVKVYRKQTLYLIRDANEMMLKLAAFRDTVTSTEHIDLDPTMRSYHVTLPESFVVSDPYFGTMYVPPLDSSFSGFPEEEFIRVSVVNGCYASSPVQLPAPARGIQSPPAGKDDTMEEITDKEQDISFRPEIGPLQATPDSITLREAPLVFQVPIMPEVPPADIELPLELDFMGKDHLWTEFWKTDEEIAQENQGEGQEIAQEVAEAGQEVLPEVATGPEVVQEVIQDISDEVRISDPDASHATLTDVSFGQTSVLGNGHQATIHEETPAVFLDPNLIDMAPHRHPASPEVTAIATDPRSRRRRPAHDYSFQLDPLDQTPPKRAKRRRLVFADREIQLTRIGMKQNIEASRETCRPLVYPKPEPIDVRSLFNRPSRPGPWDSRLLMLWRRNTRTLGVSELEEDREYWTLPSDSSHSMYEASPPLEFPKLDISPVGSAERKRGHESSEALGDQSELMRSADLSLHPSLHSISHELPLDVTRSSDDSSLSGRPSSKRKRLTKEKRGSLEEEISGISEMQTSQLPRIPEEKPEDRPSPLAAAATEEVVLGAAEMTQIPEMPEISDKDISTEHEISREIPEMVIPMDKDASTEKVMSPIKEVPVAVPTPPQVIHDIPEIVPPPQIVRDIPEEPGTPVDPVKHRSTLHKDLLRLIRGLTKKNRRTSFFEICPHQNTSRKYAACVFAILLDLCGLEKVHCSQEASYQDIAIARGSRW